MSSEENNTGSQAGHNGGTNEPQPADAPGAGTHAGAAMPPHHLTQAERDEEIEQIQRHARHQHAQIERPPELPPAPPRKALLLIAVALLLLLVAGALTMLDRAARARALAR